ncbi:hypothetical protein [Streptomyces sp. NPDC001315]|uniref:hypothetical protein n=1 Tax=Streptomyces sp. NPDC001315 TaxID=3364562 RepID=UPI0036801BC1
MTHLHSKRLPTRGVVLAAVASPVAALGLGTVGEAEAATVSAYESAASRWTDQPHGFASLADGTSGGAGGEVVTVTDQASLAKYAAAEGPYVIRVAGAVAAELVQRGSILKNTTGRQDEWGTAFDPRFFYACRLDPAAAVPALVTRFSGPQKQIGTGPA